MSNIYAIIPARYDSTRLYGKLLYKIDGESMILKTYKQVMKSKYFNKNNIYIFTDNEKIIKEMNNICQNIIMTGECENALDRISKNINKLPKQAEHIINIHADEPFIDERNIDYIVDQYLLFNIPILLHRNISTSDISDNSIVKLISDIDDNIMYFSRSIIPYLKKIKIIIIITRL